MMIDMTVQLAPLGWATIALFAVSVIGILISRDRVNEVRLPACCQTESDSNLPEAA